MANIFGRLYPVGLDEEGFRDRLQLERKRLENLERGQKALGYDGMAAYTNGRVSGIHFALSLLEEFVVRPK